MGNVPSEFYESFWFWGTGNMKTLMFQNGYHQYEILHYLRAKIDSKYCPAVHVAKLSSPDGHFAPYPGGGGCYDYDAIYMITEDAGQHSNFLNQLLLRSASTILREQNPDGGFCECKSIRPRKVRHLLAMLIHTLRALPNFSLSFERARYSLALQRPNMIIFQLIGAIMIGVGMNLIFGIHGLEC